MEQPGKTAATIKLLLLLLLPLSLLWMGLHLLQADQAIGQARQAAASGTFAEASRQMVEAAKRLPWRRELWEMAAQYALQAGEPAAAIQYLEAIGEKKLSPQGLVDLGDAYQQSGDLPAALRAWQAASQGGQATNLGRRRMLEIHLARGDYPAAIADLQALVALEPENAQLRFQLGLLLATQDPEAAMEMLEQAGEMDDSLTPAAEKVRGSILAASLSGDPAYILLSAGRALAAIGEWELAAEALEKATQARPDYAEAWAYLGEARQHLPTSTEAASQPTPGLSELQKALNLDPKSLSAHLFLALYWMRQQRFDRAEQAMQEAIALYPQEAMLQVMLGETLASAGKLNEAYQAYSQALQMAQQDATYWKYLARFSVTNNYQIEQVGLPAARQAVTLTPRDAEALDVLAQALMKSGDLASAERLLERALQYDPSYAPAHLHLGMIYWLRGDATAAYQEFRQVYELAPESPAAEQVNRLLEGLGKP